MTVLFIKCLVQCLACNKIATTINFYYSCLLDFPVCLHTLVCILIPFLYGTPFVSTLIPFESLPMLKYSAHMLFFSSSPLETWVTWHKEPTHWKRPWWWDRLKSGRKGDDRGWDGWMASLTRWTWVWASSGSWWWTGNPGVCGVTMSRTWLSNWTELNWPPKSNSLGVLVPLACPQVQKSVVGYRIFLIVQESLWYNWSALYGVIFWAASWWGQWWPPLRVLMLYPACPRSAAARAPVPTLGHCWPMLP